VLQEIRRELRLHAPFTIFGALTGVAIVLGMAGLEVRREVSGALFWALHPLHVLFSAVATASMFRLRGAGGLASTLAVGYLGSVGIATLSDCLIPFAGEWLLDLPERGLRLGFVERWWLVNPLALAGIGIGVLRPRTRLPHAAHVLLSTWASLFHMTLATGLAPSADVVALVGLFLFLAVWVPCCTSDIAFPLLLVRPRGRRGPPAGTPGGG
jgi:hypothetical protein